MLLLEKYWFKVSLNALVVGRGMAQREIPKETSKLASCDAYFETIQSRKKLPMLLQENLTEAFTRIPVSSFPKVPGGKGI